MAAWGVAAALAALWLLLALAEGVNGCAAHATCGPVRDPSRRFITKREQLALRERARAMFVHGYDRCRRAAPAAAAALRLTRRCSAT
jgi:hypothetical protein